MITTLRLDFEYKRHGVQTLMAAFIIRTGCVVTQIVRRRDADATVSFMEKVAQAFPRKRSSSSMLGGAPTIE